MTHGRPTNGNLAERFLGLVLGAAGAIAVFLFRYDLPSISTGAQQLFASTVDVSAIAAGFIATAKALLLSFKGTKQDEWITRTGLSGTLAFLFRNAAVSAILTSAISLVCVGWLGVLEKPMPWELLCFWVFSLVLSFVSIAMALRVFFRLFQKKADQA